MQGQPTQPGARNWDTQTGSGRADFATPPSIFYTYAFVIIIILKGHEKSYLDENQELWDLVAKIIGLKENMCHSE